MGSAGLPEQCRTRLYWAEEGLFIHHQPAHMFFLETSVLLKLTSSMEEFSNGQEAEEGRFQELEEDVLEDWVNIGEIKEAKDCSFGKIYNPIRALFAADSIVLEKFSNCIDHMERLKFLVEMQVVKNSLADITVSSPKLKEEDFPTRTDETTPPRKPACLAGRRPNCSV